MKTTLLPKLIKGKKQNEALRIWIPACATGEEAFSIAMMLLEIQDGKAGKIPIQIFATDLSTHAIGKARVGLYSKEDLESVSPKRIQRFFNKSDGGYRVNKTLRDMCVFAPHNILQDPPFSRLDFISCCNLFIYLDAPAQKKAVNTFHYALNENGFLMLGKAETISSSAHLFTAINKEYKIFLRKTDSGTRKLSALISRFPQQPFLEKDIERNPNRNRQRQNNSSKGNLDNAIDAVLISEFMPASVVINHQLEIVQFRGNTDAYLTHPKGKASLNILKMARVDIAFELRNAISKAIKTNQRVYKSGIEMNNVKGGRVVKIVSLEVVLLKMEWSEPLILILFYEIQQIATLNKADDTKSTNSIIVAKNQRIKKLEEELATAHSDALAFSQEQEAFNEELQSANEEVVSSNEELQTVNEELETSKEEIESANEELITANQELQIRNDLLNEAYEYAEALVSTMHDPLIVLDKNLRIKSANKAFYKFFRVKDDETEGKLLYDLGNKQWNIPQLRELLEDIIPKNAHFHDFEIIHNFPDIGEKVLLLNASRIIRQTNREQFILVAVHDATERSIAQRKIQLSEKRFSSMVYSSPFMICILKGKELIIELANDAMLETWGKGKDVVGKSLLTVLPELSQQGLDAILLNVFESGNPYYAYDLAVKLNRNGKTETSYYTFVYQAQRNIKNEIEGVAILASEVTEQATVNQKIVESENRYRDLSQTLERKVEERTAALEDANETLEQKNTSLQKMNKELEAFNYVSSHDLQEPLRKIQTLADRILEKEKHNLSENGKNYFQLLQNAAQRMQTLIRDLLSFSRLGEADQKFESIDLNVIIEEVKEEFKEVITEKNATIQIKDICQIKVIPFQFRQLMHNLIGNALKFSSSELPPHIIIESQNIDYNKLNIANLPPAKQYCRITISDNGIGFEKQFSEKIFELFQRLHSTSQYAGTGIGLAIVKKVVDNHNGKIIATSELGKGTTFDIYIPVTQHL